MYTERRQFWTSEFRSFGCRETEPSGIGISCNVLHSVTIDTLDIFRVEIYSARTKNPWRTSMGCLLVEAYLRKSRPAADIRNNCSQGGNRNTRRRSLWLTGGSVLRFAKINPTANLKNPGWKLIFDTRREEAPLEAQGIKNMPSVDGVRCTHVQSEMF